MREKTKTCAKIATLAALAAASSVVTSMVMTRLGQARAAEAAATVPRTTISVGSAPAGFAPQAFQPGRGVVASGLMRLVGVETAGNTVHVAAEAFIHDTRPGMRFVWAVRVLDPNDKEAVLYERLYDNQVFDLLGLQARAATFEDKLPVPLPAGKYRLELTWFGVPPESGLAGLKSAVVRRRYQGLSATVPITLGL